MKSILVAVLLTTFVIVPGVYGFTADGGFETESISIPYYDDQRVFRSGITEMSPMESELNGFLSRHGNWAIQVNERTELIRQAHPIGHIFL